MIRRCFPTIFILLLAMAMLGAPLSDVISFGLHEHVAGADGDQDAGHLEQSGSNGVHTGHHHCELSMNPGHTCRLRDPGVPPTITALAVSNPARFVALPPAAPVPPPRS